MNALKKTRSVLGKGIKNKTLINKKKTETLEDGMTKNLKKRMKLMDRKPEMKKLSLG